MKRFGLWMMCFWGLLLFVFADAFARDPLDLFKAAQSDMAQQRSAEKRRAPPDKCCLCVPSTALKPTGHELSISTCSCKVCDDKKAEDIPDLIRTTKQKNGQLLVRLSNERNMHSVLKECIRTQKLFIYREFDNRAPTMSCQE